MEKSKRVVLKKEREKALLQKHPWIFSGAIDFLPECEKGEIFPVYSFDGTFLAQAYFNPDQSLIGRVIDFSSDPIPTILERKIQKALLLREQLFEREKTNCFRLINAEGDGLPGLIVDVYHQTVVIQISTWGMERLRPLIVETLLKILSPKTLYEKSSSSRSLENLPEGKSLLFGEEVLQVEVLENGLRFLVDIVQGQKTGFFLDQRGMRECIKKLSKNKRVLNAFSYTGGFSLYALQGGAQEVVSLDRDQRVLDLAVKNAQINGLPSDKHTTLCQDAFKFLEQAEKLPYDLVILDPPAFAKKKADTVMAARGYKEINRQVLSKMPSGSFLLTSSCSYHVDKTLFQQILFQASIEAKREVRILSHHIQALDHPVDICHPEGEYLKSLFLYIE